MEDLVILLSFYYSIGKFQLLTTIILTVGFMTGNYMTTTISFLELQPKYICTDGNGTDYSCKNTDFCGKNISYTINYTDNTSLENWV